MMVSEGAAVVEQRRLVVMFLSEFSACVLLLSAGGAFAPTGIENQPPLGAQM